MEPGRQPEAPATSAESGNAMFDKVVFAGGGNRCWWQAGFWDALTARIELRPRVIAAVSAGAATACLLHANDSRRALAWFQRELGDMRSNVRWTNLLRRGQPLMPHAAIYRKALRALLGGDRFRELLWSAPEIRVAVTRLPPGRSPLRASASGLMAYALDKYVDRSLHSTRGRRLGFTHEIHRVQDCRTDRELIDLLVASSSTPPFTPVEMLGGMPCLDGGLVDTAPVDVVADVPGGTLVLLTRFRPGLAPVFVRDGSVYVQPSRPIAVSSWDYTSPARFRAAHELGVADGNAFVALFDRDGLPLSAAPTPQGTPLPAALPASPVTALPPVPRGTLGTAASSPAIPESLLSPPRVSPEPIAP